MPITNISPDIDHYIIAQGIVSIKAEGDSDYVLCGNVSEFAYTLTATRLKHKSSMAGTRFTDADVVTDIDSTVALKMDEATARNMSFALLATTEAEGGSSPILIDIGSQRQIKAAIRLIGTNDVGAKSQIDLPSCRIAPTGALALIGTGTWGEINLQAEVLGDVLTGIFGRYAWNTGGVLVPYP
jgi:hypothetical protein